MDSELTKIPCSCLIERIPDVLHYKDDIVLLTEIDTAKAFKHPFKLDGAFVGVMLEGDLVVNINLKQFELHSGQMIITSPGHILQCVSGTAKHTFGMAISIDFLLGLNLSLKLRDLITDMVVVCDAPIVSLSEEAIREIRSLYELIFKNVENDSVYRREILRSLCASYIYTIGRIFMESTNRLSAKSDGISRRNKEVFLRFMELLDKHHQSERSVAFYAEKLFISPKHLSSLVKKVSGENASDWIDRYVILESKSLLMHSDKSVQEVAYTLNFPNPSFFGKYFKHHTGMSPGEYRSL